VKNPQSVDRITVVGGDITDEDSTAIVNAANTELRLGSGVAGAIRQKGGAKIQQECKRHGPVPLGGTALTSGGRLKARWVIHAAAMNLGESVTRQSLQTAVINSLTIASDHRMSIISFPAVGTGVGGFEIRSAVEIMISATADFLQTHQFPEKVRFALIDRERLDIFTEVLKQFGNL